MATIVHFDISADDLQRAKKFYEQLFDWKIEKFPAGPQEYYLIETQTDTGEKGVGGGMAMREKEDQGITNFIQVESIDDSLKKVIELGGLATSPKMPIPDGHIATCLDTEGNAFGLLEMEKK